MIETHKFSFEIIINDYVAFKNFADEMSAILSRVKSVSIGNKNKYRPNQGIIKSQ